MLVDRQVVFAFHRTVDRLGKLRREAPRFGQVGLPVKVDQKNLVPFLTSVSSTHLDVYKRQQQVCPCYAEGFGIDLQKVLPLGSPRCDRFADDRYKAALTKRFYAENPQLADKKIVLFARCV